MSIVKILAPVTGAKRDAVVLATAFAAAKPFNAHVKAVFIHGDPREAIPYSEMPLSPDVVQELVDSAQELAEAGAKAARATLAATAAAAKVEIVAAPVKADHVTASFQDITGHVASSIDREARFAELIVLPPISGADGPEAHDAFIQVLTRSGRPVLLSALVAPAEIGRKIAVGWDGGTAAAHAIAAALPYLHKAAAVKILTVQHTPSEAGEIDALKDYLALHGVSCSQCVINRGARGVAEFLLDTAAGDGCDLLVVGGYGHSRLRESIFGGVTQYIVSHPKIPVLMVH
jgi:nucleotide-binding universal stress UspA family protein